MKLAKGSSFAQLKKQKEEKGIFVRFF